MAWLLKLLRTPPYPRTAPAIRSFPSYRNIDGESQIESPRNSESCHILRELLKAGLVVAKFPNDMISKTGAESFDAIVSSVAAKLAESRNETDVHSLKQITIDPESMIGRRDSPTPAESVAPVGNNRANESEAHEDQGDLIPDTASDISDTLSTYLLDLRTESPGKNSTTSHPSSVTSHSTPPSPTLPESSPEPTPLHPKIDLPTLPDSILETEYVKFTGNDFLLRQLDLKQQAERHNAKLIEYQGELHDKIRGLEQLIFQFRRRELRSGAEITSLKRKLVQERIRVEQMKAVPGVWVPME
jgi:hypothetical protein